MLITSVIILKKEIRSFADSSNVVGLRRAEKLEIPFKQSSRENCPAVLKVILRWGVTNS